MYGPCLSAIVADRPLSPATRHSLGRPLPYQQADGTRAHLQAINLYPFGTIGYYPRFLGVISDLEVNSHALLTRSPRHPSKLGRVRLAYLRHAASVRPELGSNSQINILSSLLLAKATLLL